ncbi:unnamed protein product [Chrysoparadoxa australica]
MGLLERWGDGSFEVPIENSYAERPRQRDPPKRKRACKKRDLPNGETSVTTCLSEDHTKSLDAVVAMISKSHPGMAQLTSTSNSSNDGRQSPPHLLSACNTPRAPAFERRAATPAAIPIVQYVSSAEPLAPKSGLMSTSLHTVVPQANFAETSTVGSRSRVTHPHSVTTCSSSNDWWRCDSRATAAVGGVAFGSGCRSRSMVRAGLRRCASLPELKAARGVQCRSKAKGQGREMHTVTGWAKHGSRISTGVRSEGSMSRAEERTPELATTPPRPTLTPKPSKMLRITMDYVDGLSVRSNASAVGTPCSEWQADWHEGRLRMPDARAFHAMVTGGVSVGTRAIFSNEMGRWTSRQRPPTKEKNTRAVASSAHLVPMPDIPPAPLLFIGSADKFGAPLHFTGGPPQLMPRSQLRAGGIAKAPASPRASPLGCVTSLSHGLIR